MKKVTKAQKHPVETDVFALDFLFTIMHTRCITNKIIF
jgi:hypothetical protein